MGKTETRAEKISKLTARLKEIKAAFYKRSDIGAANLFADVFHDTHRYNVSAREWFRYQSGIWEIDTEGMSAKADLKLLGEALVQYAASVEFPDDEENKKKNDYIKYACKWLNSGFRASLLNDAKDFNYFSREELDRDVFVLNCKNGVLFVRDGKAEFKPHKPEYLLSKMTGTEYKPDAVCPRFDKFMDEVTEGDTGKQKYLQKIAGLSLVGDVPEHKFFVIYGSTTRNGKSTFTETLLHILGTYGATINPETLAIQKVDSRRASGDLARLAGVRLAVCSEAPRRMPLDSALLKKLTGGEKVLARHLMEREFEYQPQFTLLMNTNYLPATTDSTVFSSGRIAVCEFNRHFEESEQDKHLKNKLFKESAGILNWMIEGYQLYLSEGLEPPETVQSETAQYEADSDRIGCFLDECLIKEDKGCISVKDVYPEYVKWCENSGYQACGKQSFIQELKVKRIFKDTGTINGKTVKRVLRGYSEFIKTDRDFEELAG